MDETENSEISKQSELFPLNDPFCEPCEEQGKQLVAAYYCKECDEYLCTTCVKNHKTTKATKCHVSISVSEKQAMDLKACEPCKKMDETENSEISKQSELFPLNDPFCEPCEEQGKQLVAAYYCKECDEYLCTTCVKNHKTTKATKCHVPISVSEKQAMDFKACEPCKENDITQAAINFCKECEEYLCKDCTNRHRSSKATKTHVPVRKEIIESALKESEDIKKQCEPCAALGRSQSARQFCEPCEEFLCESCIDSHRRAKATKSHVPVSIDLIKSSSLRPETFCDICKLVEKQSKAEKFCQECDETLCDDCVEKHRVQKITKGHNIKPLSERQTDLELCELCANNKKSISASLYCKVCPEYLCETCAELHRKQKATRDHVLGPLPPKLQGISKLCDFCCGEEVSVEATHYCSECEEFLCEPCGKRHRSQKSTKSHQLCSSDDAIANLDKCELCSESERSEIAENYCKQCQQCYCTNCSEIHKKQKATNKHNLVSIKERANMESSSTSSTERNVPKEIPHQKDDVNPMRPGKPVATNSKADSLILSWDRPEKFRDGDYYQVSYRNVDSKGKWKFVSGEHATSTTEILDLQSNTKFVFRVRVVNEDGEGPYSPESEECCTTNSPASRLFPFAKEIEASIPKKLALPTTELRTARNDTAKTKKFEIGSPSKNDMKEKTIMLVGATGTGKSTLVDGIVNYVLGVKWSDPFRFSVIDLEQDEKDRVKNQAQSQTEWITCYTLHPEKGSRLNYVLTIIDTPGFGDTRGLKRDQEIVEQIRQLFSETGPKGVVCIDAVCFLIKAPDARLTAVQSYIFQSVMALFGKDIERNICSLITFADGLDPPVLAALKESGLPFGRHFTFNNSGLFAKNVDIDSLSLSPMFWDMGLKSFRAFFNYLDKAETRSLQLTKDVLDERFRLEATVTNLQPQLDAGLSKVNQLKEEIKILNENKTVISDNANFEYEVPETQHKKKELPPGIHVTNCTHCNFTCHDNCVFANDADKARCSAMKPDGHCKVCPNSCHWEEHANTPYIFEYVEVKVKKTYAEMRDKYQKASGKVLTQEQILEKMGAELDDMIDDIEEMMVIVKSCNERLKEIALRPNPLSMTDHIDLMIENEKLEKKNGFLERIKVLQVFRKRAQIATDVETFSKDARSALGNARKGKDKKRDILSVLSRVKRWFSK